MGTVKIGRSKNDFLDCAMIMIMIIIMIMIVPHFCSNCKPVS